MVVHAKEFYKCYIGTVFVIFFFLMPYILHTGGVLHKVYLLEQVLEIRVPSISLEVLLLGQCAFCQLVICDHVVAQLPMTTGNQAVVKAFQQPYCTKYWR